jgi:hypothetical protein
MHGAVCGIHTHGHTDTQTHRHTDTQTHNHTDTEPHRHTDTQTHRHTDTNTETDTYTNTHTTHLLRTRTSPRILRSGIHGLRSSPQKARPIALLLQTTHDLLWYSRSRGVGPETCSKSAPTNDMQLVPFCGALAEAFSIMLRCIIPKGFEPRVITNLNTHSASGDERHTCSFRYLADCGEGTDRCLNLRKPPTTSAKTHTSTPLCQQQPQHTITLTTIATLSTRDVRAATTNANHHNRQSSQPDHTN